MTPVRTRRRRTTRMSRTVITCMRVTAEEAAKSHVEHHGKK